MLLARKSTLWRRKCEMQPRKRRSAATSTAAHFRALFLALTIACLAAVEVDGDVGGRTGASSGSGKVRTVMDLMEVMLNRDILDMLANGGYDFRQPTRIFLPPKFHSNVPLDRGHMSPEEILAALKSPTPKQLLTAPGESVSPISTPSSTLLSPLVGPGEVDERAAPYDGAANRPPFGREQVQVLDAPDGSRINLISYSDGKVTKAVGGTGAKKPTLAGSTRTPDQRRPVTSSITDQTVKPNGARTLPVPAAARSAGNGRSALLPFAGDGSGSSSSTDRLRSALPGEPDVDYPIFDSVPATTFSCDKRQPGYYADVEARCQVFRVCANTDSTGRGFAFLCPNGTLFNQRHLVCDWYMNVRCADSENYYSLNDELGRMMADSGRSVVSGNQRDMMQVVMSMVTYPMRSLMEQMNGVGVLEERIGQLDDPRSSSPMRPPSLDSTGVGQPIGPSTYLMPIQTKLEPPVKDTGDNVPRENLPGLQNSQVYTPKVDNNVYVSSLGTLSTDMDSGFDPTRSTLLTRTGAARTGTLQDGISSASDFAGQLQSNQVSSLNPSVLSNAGPNDFKLIKADLVKTWNGPGLSTTSLRPVPQPESQQPTFRRLEPRPAAERFQQPIPVPQQPAARQGVQGLLPPTGVLPPTSFTRTASSGGRPLTPSMGYPEHRFTPVRRVLSVQKVTVLPEQSQQTSRAFVDATTHYSQPAYSGNQQPHRSHVTPANLHQLPASPIVATDFPNNLQYVYHTTGDSLSHRHGSTSGYHSAHHSLPLQIPQAFHGSSRCSSSSSSGLASPLTPVRRNDGPRLGPVDTRESDPVARRKSTVLVQVVPALSFYLNNAQEKREYDEAIRQGLLDDRRRVPFTSYDVPQSSVGQL